MAQALPTGISREFRGDELTLTDSFNSVTEGANGVVHPRGAPSPILLPDRGMRSTTAADANSTAYGSWTGHTATAAWLGGYIHFLARPAGAVTFIAGMLNANSKVADLRINAATGTLGAKFNDVSSAGVSTVPGGIYYVEMYWKPSTGDYEFWCAVDRGPLVQVDSGTDATDDTGAINTAWIGTWYNPDAQVNDLVYAGWYLSEGANCRRRGPLNVLRGRRNIDIPNSISRWDVTGRRSRETGVLVA